MSLGITLQNQCVIVHDEGGNIKHPFADVPDLTMHELEPGVSAEELLGITPQTTKTTQRSYHGQFGFIEFNTSIRLPRHVHIGQPATAKERCLIAERIMVLAGAAIVELNGQLYVIPPGSLVTIAPGVPHTWTACPAGYCFPDGSMSEGRFTMVYEYEAPTGFFPTSETGSFKDVEDYVQYKGNLDDIRIPKLGKDEIETRCIVAWKKTLITPQTSK